MSTHARNRKSASSRDRALKKASEFYLLDLKNRFESGDPLALLEAVGVCGRGHVTMPEWVVAAWHKAWHKWLNYEVKELGEAFGIAWPNKKHLEAAQQKKRLAFVVNAEVERLHKSGRKIDQELYEEIGGRFGIGKTRVTEYRRYVREQLKALSNLRTPNLDKLLEPYVVGGAPPDSEKS